MRRTRRAHLFLVTLGIVLMNFSARSQQLPRIPEHLLHDEHIREEFGVNAITTPSIKKIFGILDQLGNLSYDDIKRPMPSTPPRDRTLIALGLGGLIADGFLVVQAEKLNDLEDVGRAIRKYAIVLGAGTKVTSHVKSLLEHSTDGEWDQLKEELAATQADVEGEMVQLRDLDAVHLISLGGWLRAFEIGCTASLQPFDTAKAETLRHVDVAEYYIQELNTMDPRISELEHIRALADGLTEIRDIIQVPEDQKFTEEDVKRMRDKVAELVKLTAPAEVEPNGTAQAQPEAEAEAGAGAEAAAEKR